MNSNEVDDQTFNQAYLIAAGLIREFGPKYIAVFEGMNFEMEARKARQNLLSLALQLPSNTVCKKHH